MRGAREIWMYANEARIEQYRHYGRFAAETIAEEIISWDAPMTMAELGYRWRAQQKYAREHNLIIAEATALV